MFYVEKQSSNKNSYIKNYIKISYTNNPNC